MTAEADVLQVLSAYRLPPIGAIARLDAGQLSPVYKVQAGSCFYCLKPRKQEIGIDLDLEEEFLQALAAGGFQLIPHLVPSRSGRRRVESHGRSWSLYDFIESDRPFHWLGGRWHESHCFSAGGGLAQLHFNGKNCLPVLAPRPSILPGLPVRLADGLDLAHSFPRNSTGAAVLPQRMKLLGGLSRCLSEISRFHGRTGEPPLIVHGDYHPGNLLFKGHELRAILDFEYIRLEHRAYDLAYSAIYFAAGRRNCLEGAIEINKPFLQAFFSGYLDGLSRLQTLPEWLHELHVIDRAIEILAPYMRAACYLNISWFLGQGQPENAKVAKGLSHSLNTLDMLDNMPGAS